MHRRVAALLLAVTFALVVATGAWGHAGLVQSDPLAGATLGASPTAIRLTFSENPQISLSSVHVLGTGGAAFQTGPAAAVPGDPLALTVPVRRLPRGVYTVEWRIVSAVDGHATAGAYAFGVGVSPKGAVAAAPTTSPVASRLEMLARWLFLTGLVLLLGAATAGAAAFGGSTGSDRRLAAAGWLLSAGGLLLLAEAQRRNAGASLGTLLGTPVGHALVRRAVALGLAGAALLAARRREGRRVALGIAAFAALAAVVAHVDAGHAAAGPWPHGLTIAAQSAHIAAAGIWLGGLAALVLGVRGAVSAEKAAAVRRFSALAAIGLVVVAVTGTLRAVDELGSVGQLFSTGYGRAISLKVVLLLGIAAFGARNRYRSVPAAGETLEPLRRTSRGELVLAAAAIAVAAILGTLAPPAAGQPVAPTGLAASGADFATSVRVELTAASADPGPNAFVAKVVDYDTKRPVRGAQVSLRFTPLDDPGVPSTTLPLRPTAGDAYTGTGPNLVFDGRWQTTVLVQRGADSVEVPLELDLEGPTQFVSVRRIPGRAPSYTVQVTGAGNLGDVRFTPDPEREGQARLTVTVYDIFGDEAPTAHLVLTAAPGDDPLREVPVRRVGKGSFRARIDLPKGLLRLAAVARASDGTRARAAVQIDAPGR